MKNTDLVFVVNKRKSSYTVGFPDGTYFQWLPATPDFEDMHELTFAQIQRLHMTSSTFKHGYLFIDNEEARKRLGLEKEEIKANLLSREDIEAVLNSKFLVFKKELKKITNQQLIKEIVDIALEVNIKDVDKLKYLEEISGIPMELMLERKEDEKE